MIHYLKCETCQTRKFSCFKNLPCDDLCEMDRVKITTFYKKGQIIFHEGMEPTGIYCLHEGKVKLSRNEHDGKEQIMRIAVEGELIGIRALLGGRRYYASATALQNSIVCYVNKAAFFRFKLKHPDVSNYLIVQLSTLLEEAEAKITSLALKPVRERLAESLVILDQIFNKDRRTIQEVNGGDVISLSREDLANIVGTATETVIRTLSEFSDEGLVRMKGRKIRLLDVNSLKRIGKVNEETTG